VQAEVSIDENKGAIKIVLLKTVSDEVTDPASQISLEEARFGMRSSGRRPDGDSGRFRRVRAHGGSKPPEQRIIQRVREGREIEDPRRFSSRVGDLLSGEVQQIERGKLVIMLNKFREAGGDHSLPRANHREHFHQGDPSALSSSVSRKRERGRVLFSAEADALFVKALFKLEVPEIQQNLVEIRPAR